MSVVFIGDSIVQNWDLARFFPGKAWINRGIGGEQTVEILARFQRDALVVRPETVFLLAGTNDIAKGGTVWQVVDNLRRMVRMGVAQGCQMIVSSVLPVSDYHKEKEARFERTAERPPEIIRAINREAARMAKEEGAIFLDLHAVIADASGQMPADFAPDGLHPNAAGYAVLSPVVQNAITSGLAT